MSGGVNKYYPSLKGKTVIITGGNSGIGFAAAQELLKLNPRNLILACRNEEKALIAINKLKNGKKNDNLTFVKLDLSDL